MSSLLALALGAIAGALLRYQATLWAAARFGTGFPYGTLLVNLVGSFILGFFLALATRGGVVAHPTLRLFVATGFCGSLTTFSTLSYETVLLLTDGRLLPALLNAAGSVVAGLLCVVLGAALA
nr:fluoride efflux transporter CrcB [Ardenticatenales bacterium]